jgi:hypothetical protein
MAEENTQEGQGQGARTASQNESRTSVLNFVFFAGWNLIPPSYRYPQNLVALSLEG